MIKPLLLAGLLASASLSAHAAQSVVAGKSALAFVFSQMNTPIEGAFKRFDAKINFDPAKPAQARALITVDIASIDVGGPDGNHEASRKAWFNTQAFPQATFQSTQVKALGNNRFEVRGKLAIKGISRDVVGQMTATRQGNLLELKGSIPVSRLAFKLGEGAWADTGTVAETVNVNFRLSLQGQPD